ncbi:GNAT family N-acetyltransferase [Fibrella arboris]|uniref:GNAT family N-acetyltransferase n=1 Tax=Fibrella arboris TaxID=3242486 RepID=UPI00351FCF36
MITYRTAQLADAASIAQAHTQSWRLAYRGILRDDYLDGAISDERDAVWQQRLGSPAANQRVLIAEEAGRFSGFICLFLDAEPQFGTLIDNLHVLPTLKGRGVGAGLMREAARQVIPQATQPGFHLSVYEANRAAIHFYERMGGVNVGREVHETPGGGEAVSLRYAWKTAADLQVRKLSWVR